MLNSARPTIISLAIYTLCLVLILTACARPSPTVVPQPTMTLTQTPTLTPTATPSVNWTPTATPTATPAATPTATPIAVPTATPTPAWARGWIAFSARINNNWDIYALNPASGQQIRLTADPAEDRYPAFSPDGQTLAFASRRGGSWNLYLLKPNGEVTQLTDGLPYHGAPAWSPDGRQIAFESMRAGNLDVWVMNADGSGLRNLTAPADLARGGDRADGSPVWSPDGRQIAFTSWRYEDEDILVLDVQTGETRQLTSTPTGEYLHEWRADGELVYSLIDGETQDIYSRSVNDDPESPGRRLTRWQAVETGIRSPDGAYLAFLLRYTHGARLYAQQPESPGSLPIRLTAELPIAAPLTWTPHYAAWSEAQGQPVILYVEQTHPGQGAPFDLVRLAEVEVGNPWLSDQVDDSFVAMRQRIIAETGRDFLAQLSDAWRGMTFSSEWSDYSSWHKTGRAIDTLMDYLSPDRRKRWLEVMIEPGGGEVYWRLYLYCEKQDGSQGMPLKARPWDLTYDARKSLTGGRRKPIPAGYYVDLTDLMAQYGWQRIAAHDHPDFHWHNNFVAVEHWHFQKTDGLRWYDAMREVFPPDLLDAHHNWSVQHSKKTPTWLIVAKGIPVPVAEQRAIQRLVR